MDSAFSGCGGGQLFSEDRAGAGLRAGGEGDDAMLGVVDDGAVAVVVGARGVLLELQPATRPASMSMISCFASPPPTNHP